MSDKIIIPKDTPIWPVVMFEKIHDVYYLIHGACTPKKMNRDWVLPDCYCRNINDCSFNEYLGPFILLRFINFRWNMSETVFGEGGGIVIQKNIISIPENSKAYTITQHGPIHITKFNDYFGGE